MLGYQLPQTFQNLIAHIWPVFDHVPPAQLANKLVWYGQSKSNTIISNVNTVDTEGQSMSLLSEI